MPRKGPAPRRPLVDDPVYGSKVVTQLVNRVLLDGKKTVAERIVYGALETVRERTEQEPVSVLSSSALSRTFVRPSRSAPAVSVARPTRSPSRFAPRAPRRWPCAGWSTSRVSAARRP